MNADEDSPSFGRFDDDDAAGVAALLATPVGRTDWPAQADG